MKKEKGVIYFFPVKGYAAITLFDYVFVKRRYKPISATTLNHERIHIAQAEECGGYLAFYGLYLFRYWLPALFRYRFDNNKAYHAIPFEREAYENDRNLSYLEKREKGAWRNYE
jgi:hypothetical protein